MKNMYLVGLGLLVSMSVACAAEAGDDSGSTDAALRPAPNPNPGPDPEPPAPNPNPGPEPGPLCQPLEGNAGGPGIGLANPAAVYCTALGYLAEGESCHFPDGASCEQWSFFRGECGQAHSFCHRQGGQVSAIAVDEGGWTSTHAICTLPNGSSCKEQDFAATCRCE